MAVKAPFNYIGNKYRIIDSIQEFFPENINTFVDIFCGVDPIDWENPFPAEYDVDKACEYMKSFNSDIEEMKKSRKEAIVIENDNFENILMSQ